MKRILVTGATGQIGTELTLALRDRFGGSNVVAAGHRTEPDKELRESGPFVRIDVRKPEPLHRVIRQYNIGSVYHLAAILSATAEEKPEMAWDVNMNGLLSVLEAARLHGCAVFFPSSIGAFGPSSPRDNTPQDTIQRPQTMYGVTKVAGELLADYYYQRYGVDTRGIRYPGLISHRTPPGGGTTDYAVEIFRHAVHGVPYACFLQADTRLDMMYMPDAVRAASELMEADLGRLRHRNAFNLTAMSFSPDELYREIKKLIPQFTISYEVDPMRQRIADSWPRHMDDSAARREWGWEERFDLSAMTLDMLKKLSEQAEGENRAEYRAGN